MSLKSFSGAVFTEHPVAVLVALAILAGCAVVGAIDYVLGSGDNG